MRRLTIRVPLLVAALAVLWTLGQGASLPAGQDKGKDKGKKEPPKAPEIPPKTGGSEVISLFNGKNFDGWEGHKHLWSIKDGVIIAKSTEPIKVSTYLQTKRKVTDFRLTCNVKLVESE